MIKQLQIKFISIIMALLSVVLLVILIALNIIMVVLGDRQSSALLQQVVQSGGKSIPSVGTDGDRGAVYVVRIDITGEVSSYTSRGEGTYSQSEIITLSGNLISNGLSRGQSGTLLYNISPSGGGGFLAVFLDISQERQLLARLFSSTVAVGGISILILFAVALIVTRWVTAPVVQSFSARQQFVADASHELKTPIAIISANADVLLEQYRENKWLLYIKDEAQRMQGLVNDLLYLANNDSDEVQYSFQNFSLSDMTALTAMPFESLIYESECKLTLNITPGISYRGDEQKLKQVVVILIDNAIGHTAAGGEIEVSLTKPKSRCILTVKNTGSGIAVKERKKIFERFYRSDSSRERKTGGYGLGLSIAKAITERHGGKITAGGTEGEFAEFKVIL